MKKKYIILIGILLLVITPLIYAGIISMTNKTLDISQEDKNILEQAQISRATVREYECDYVNRRCFNLIVEEKVINEWAKISTQKCLGRDEKLKVGGCNLGYRNKTNEEIQQEIDILVNEHMHELAQKEFQPSKEMFGDIIYDVR